MQPYPVAEDYQQDADSEARINWIKSFILAVRRIRAERDIAPGKPLSVSIMGGDDSEKNWLYENKAAIKSLARIIDIREVTDKPDDAVIALAGKMTLLVPLADIIDFAAEIARLQKEQEKQHKMKQASENKLANSSFTDRAPEDVINKERNKLEECVATLDKINNEIQRLEALKNS